VTRLTSVFRNPDHARRRRRDGVPVRSSPIYRDAGHLPALADLLAGHDAVVLFLQPGPVGRATRRAPMPFDRDAAIRVIDCRAAGRRAGAS